MIKFLVTGLLVYFVYKLMFNPALKEGPPAAKKIYEKEDIEIRHKNKNPRGNDEDYIEYEEVK